MSRAGSIIVILTTTLALCTSCMTGMSRGFDSLFGPRAQGPVDTSGDAVGVPADGSDAEAVDYTVVGQDGEELFDIADLLYMAAPEEAVAEAVPEAPVETLQQETPEAPEELEVVEPLPVPVKEPDLVIPTPAEAFTDPERPRSANIGGTVIPDWFAYLVTVMVLAMLICIGYVAKQRKFANTYKFRD